MHRRFGALERTALFLFALSAFLVPRTARGQGDLYLEWTIADVMARELQAAKTSESMVVTAWVQGDTDRRVYTRTLANNQLQPSQDISSGTGVKLLATPRGFFLAFASGANMSIRHGDGLSWDAPSILHVSTTAPLDSPDIAAAPDGTVYAIFRQSGAFYWSVNHPDNPVWTTPTFAFASNWGGDLELKLVGQEYHPRIYSYDGDDTIFCRQLESGAWTAPSVALAGAGSYGCWQVAARSDGPHVIAVWVWPFSVGTFIEGETGTFLPWQTLVTGTTCPLTDGPVCSFDLACDAVGSAHVFRYQESWRQEDSDIYLCSYNTSWDHSQGETWQSGPYQCTSNCYYALALAVAPSLDGTAVPSFAWGTLQRIQLRAPNSTSGAGSALSTSRGLTVQPNPGRDRVAIEWSASRPGAGVVLVFDAAGRLVRQIPRTVEAAGSQRVVWDGCDSDGRRLPAGVYNARVVCDGQTRTAPVVLLP